MTTPTHTPPHAPVETADRLIFALDVPDADTARRTVVALGDSVRFYKLGLELAMSPEYFGLIDELVASGRRIFADLKLYDIPATVAAAVRRLNGRGIHFVTVHGDRAIMEAAADAAIDVNILAVTVLTSLDRSDLQDMGITLPVGDLVVSRARGAVKAGCAGVIASGQEAAALRAELGDGPVIVTPGVRPEGGAGGDDQKRVVTVAQAFEGGADHIVVGRPIRSAPDPKAAAEAIQATIAGVFGEAR